MHESMMNEITEEVRKSIPPHMQGGLMAYIKKGCPPGDFLRAVLENNLYRAFTRADHINRDAMISYAAVLEKLPIIAWGSPESVDYWIRVGGAEGSNKT